MKHIATVPAALVKAAMLFQANQDVRRYLNGIYITHDHIVATDGHTLFVSPYESDLRPEQAVIVAIKGKISPKAHNLELLYDEESKIGVVRCGRPASEILVALHDAVLACHDRARSAGARRVIRTADERGGYVLFSGKVYFILKVDEKSGIHVVSTVMTPATMSK